MGKKVTGIGSFAAGLSKTNTITDNPILSTL